MLKIEKSTKIIQYLVFNCQKSFSTSSINLDRQWRIKRGLPENPNSFGPLTNLRDYSFIDGRPTPMGSNLRKRMLKQHEVTEKMVVMCKELDFAKERYIKLEEQKKLEKENILKSKLKPKGHLLLKK